MSETATDILYHKSIDISNNYFILHNQALLFLDEIIRTAKHIIRCTLPFVLPVRMENTHSQRDIKLLGLDVIAIWALIIIWSFLNDKVMLYCFYHI